MVENMWQRRLKFVQRLILPLSSRLGKRMLLSVVFSCIVLYFFNSFSQSSFLCSFIEINYLDKSLDRFFTNTSLVNCFTWIPLLYFDSMGKLQKNFTEIQRIGLSSNLNCTHTSVIPTGPKEYVLKGEYTIQQEVGSDIVYVKCKNKEGDLIYSDILYHIKTTVKINKTLQNESPTHPSVMLFGIDSLSALLAERTLPKTLKYVRNVLGGIEMHHYNKIGLNTLPNLLAGLLGMSLYEAIIPTFKYPEMFQSVLDSGYITCKGEDYLMPLGPMGFKFPMYHHDARKYFEVAKDIEIFLKTKSTVLRPSNHFMCKGNEAKHNILLNFNKECFIKYSGKRRLVFSWIVDISHDECKYLNLADNDILEYFKWMKSSGILDNTVLIFFGDHGPGLDSFGETDIGRYTHRSPYFNIVIPSNMKIGKTALENLRINQNRLTTPFDFHETLKDLLSSTPRTKLQGTSLPRGISLFTEIPRTRSCKDAHIPENYCPCYEPINVRYENDKQSKAIADFIVDELNLILKKGNISMFCLEWHSPKIISLYQLDISASNYKRFMITVQVLPKMAEFMATVDVQLQQIKLLSTIDRTNRYGNQPICLEKIGLFETFKPFCVCENT